MTSSIYQDLVNAMLAGETVEVDGTQVAIAGVRSALRRELQDLPAELFPLRLLRHAMQPNGNIRMWLVSAKQKVCYTVVTKPPNNDNSGD
jgi:hypothetical protein